MVTKVNNKFIINMDKDIGKKKCIKFFSDYYNIDFWQGIDNSLLNKDGYLLENCNKKESTECAKRAKLNLFLYFLEYNLDDEYIWLFEDDIHIHKNFSTYVNKIDNFLSSKKPAILYMGLSSNIKINNCTEINFDLVNSYKLDKSKSSSGAYSVIIRRNIIKQIISHIKNPIFKYEPFDNTCLGFIQKKYIYDCYFCNPLLIVPDIGTSNIRKNFDQNIYWDKFNISRNDYLHHKFKYIFAYVGNMHNKISEFNNLYKLFYPYYKIVFIVNETIKSYEYHDFLQCGSNKSQCIQKKLETETYNDYYIETSIDLKFKYMDGKKIIDIIEKNIKKYDILNIFNKHNSYFIVKNFPLINKYSLTIDDIDFDIY